MECRGGVNAQKQTKIVNNERMNSPKREWVGCRKQAQDQDKQLQQEQQTAKEASNAKHLAQTTFNVYHHR